jgi:hypothetical protein
VSHNVVVMTRLPRVEVGAVGKSVPKSDRQLEKYSWSPQVWSVVNLRVSWLVEEVTPNLKSCWQWCYGGDVSRGAMSLPSHAGDGATES